MTKTIAITGATGAQGGGVANVMRMATGWTVRAVTRNPRSEAAKRLTGQGIEVVQADFDDEDSLARAFEVNPPPPQIPNPRPLSTGRRQQPSITPLTTTYLCVPNPDCTISSSAQR